MSEIDPTADLNQTPQRGRPALYNSAIHPAIARAVAMLGATRPEIAEACGCHERTLNRWILEHEEFADAMRTGRKVADERVEDSLYKRAIGYEVDELHVEVSGSGAQQSSKRKSIKRHISPDVTACIFWLKNRKPQQWRDRPEGEQAQEIPANQQSAAPATGDFDYAELARRVQQRFVSGHRPNTPSDSN